LPNRRAPPQKKREPLQSRQLRRLGNPAILRDKQSIPQIPSSDAENPSALGRKRTAKRRQRRLRLGATRVAAKVLQQVLEKRVERDPGARAGAQVFVHCQPDVQL